MMIQTDTQEKASTPTRSVRGWEVELAVADERVAQAMAERTRVAHERVAELIELADCYLDQDIRPHVRSKAGQVEVDEVRGYLTEAAALLDIVRGVRS